MKKQQLRINQVAFLIKSLLWIIEGAFDIEGYESYEQFKEVKKLIIKLIVDISNLQGRTISKRARNYLGLDY